MSKPSKPRLLDPYRGIEVAPLTGQALRDEVAFYKRAADEDGEPYDPEWDRWLAEDDPSTDRLRG